MSRIQQVALLFDEHGYHNVTVERVVAAGVVVGSCGTSVPAPLDLPRLPI